MNYLNEFPTSDEGKVDSNEQFRRCFEEFSQRLRLSFADSALAIKYFRNMFTRPENRHQVCLAQIVLFHQKL
jgi:hypothetical protein